MGLMKAKRHMDDERLEMYRALYEYSAPEPFSATHLFHLSIFLLVYSITFLTLLI